MKLIIPEHIDLNTSEDYILLLGVNSDYFSFSLIERHDLRKNFYFEVKKSQTNNPFLSFKELIFENEFFSYSFHKIYILNYSSQFTYVPSILYEEKDKKKYLDFLFSEAQNKILSYSLKNSDAVIVHSMCDETYEFLCRTFVDASILPYTASLSDYLVNSNIPFSKRMIVVKKNDEMDIYCFNGSNILLINHFSYYSLQDAVYYPLFLWKQLKFDQLKDFLFIQDNEQELRNHLANYIQNIETLDLPVPFERNKVNIPVEMVALF